MTIVNINGHSMNYIDRGEGTAVLFIHPPVLTSLNFTYQIQELSPSFRTIAFDIRGHGKSQPSAQPITYPLIAEDIVQLIVRLGINKCFLCGYSTGGTIVLEFLLNYPDRAWGGVVIGGMSEVNDWRLKNLISVGAGLAKIGAVNTLAFSTAWGQTNKLSLFRKLYKDARKGNARNIEQYYRYSLTCNCTSRLQEIRLPVLLIYGEKDRHFHPYAKILYDRLPNSELVFISKANHRIPTKVPVLLNELIEKFVNKLGQS
ncbi:alpha/beta hydrolase [Paenibacillus larvae]